MPADTTTDTLPTRVLPGQDGRAQALADNLELSATVQQLDAQLRAAQAGTGGLLPMVLHVSGVEWNGSQRRLHRCGAAGELADSWLVQIGPNMLTRSGHTIPFKPYHHVGRSLQDKVRHTLAEAIAAARK